MGIKKDLRGMKFGKLTVIEESEPCIGSRGEHLSRWCCFCDCGTTKIIRASELLRGHTISCGCARKENRIKSITTHGKSKTRQYHIYLGMLSRCYDKSSQNYKNYGGRGIKVCEEWLGEQGVNNFYEWSLNSGYDDNLTLDRIEVNGDYSPDNCRWISNKDQQNNKRNNIYISIDGETLTIKQWSEKMNINYSTIKQRMRNGWKAEDAVLTPTDLRYSHKK